VSPKQAVHYRVERGIGNDRRRRDLDAPIEATAGEERCRVCSISGICTAELFCIFRLADPIGFFTEVQSREIRSSKDGECSCPFVAELVPIHCTEVWAEFSAGPVVVAAQVKFLVNDLHVMVLEYPYPIIVVLSEVEAFVIVSDALEDLAREDAARPKNEIGLRDLSSDVLVGDPNLLHEIIILFLRNARSLSGDTIAPATY